MHHHRYSINASQSLTWDFVHAEIGVRCFFYKSSFNVPIEKSISLLAVSRAQTHGIMASSIWHCR